MPPTTRHTPTPAPHPPSHAAKTSKPPSRANARTAKKALEHEASAGTTPTAQPARSPEREGAAVSPPREVTPVRSSSTDGQAGRAVPRVEVSPVGSTATTRASSRGPKSRGQVFLGVFPPARASSKGPAPPAVPAETAKSGNGPPPPNASNPSTAIVPALPLPAHSTVSLSALVCVTSACSHVTKQSPTSSPTVPPSTAPASVLTPDAQKGIVSLTVRFQTISTHSVSFVYAIVTRKRPRFASLWLPRGRHGKSYRVLRMVTPVSDNFFCRLLVRSSLVLARRASPRPSWASSPRSGCHGS